MPYQHIERINLNIFNPTTNSEDDEEFNGHDDEEFELEQEPEPLNYEIHSCDAPFLFYPETSVSDAEVDMAAELTKNLFENYYRIPYTDVEHLKAQTQGIAKLHERTNWTDETPYPRASYACVIPKSECGTEELEIVAAMVKLLPTAQSYTYYPIILPIFELVTEEKTEEETDMKSEQEISNEIRDVFDVFWDKIPEYPNPRIKPINNFWETFKVCQTLPDPHALNSKKMVGWKVATFEKNEEYFRCNTEKSPTQIELIPFKAREFVSPTLVVANLLNFGSNCVMFGNPKREFESEVMYDMMMDWLDDSFPLVQPVENHWKTIS